MDLPRERLDEQKRLAHKPTASTATLFMSRTRCRRKVEMSGFCKVEMSKLPFRELAEAEIGTFDDEWKRAATG